MVPVKPNFNSPFPRYFQGRLKVPLLALVLILLGLQAFAFTGQVQYRDSVEEVATVQYFEEGTNYYRRGQYGLALDRFYLAAMAGNSEAAIQAGLMHDFGRGVPRDFNEAGKWYNQAAAMGSSKGLFLLGHMEEFGEGRPKNYAKAYRWYREAAELGESNAQFSLGEFYLYGKFVRPNKTRAEHWLSLAADQCNPAAIDLLGKIAPGNPSTQNSGC